MEGISTHVLNFVKSVAAAVPPLCFVIGVVFIIKGLIRYGQSNSRAHNGKGAISYIVTGSLIMNAKMMIEIVITTLQKAGLNVPDVFN